MRKTAAPDIASFFKALNARLASFKGKTWTCVRIGILAASARNSWPSCRVLFAETWGQPDVFYFGGKWCTGEEKDWRSEGDDFRTFLSELVSALPQSGISIYANPVRL
jgi:hypothetical protein